MFGKKNEARLTYKDQTFMIWQDSNSNWVFSYSDLQNVSTSTKELQVALNMIYESIDDKTTRYYSKSKKTKSKPKTIFDKLDEV